MDIFKIIKSRKTVRKYTDKPIRAKVLNKIVEAGIWGPSVHGMQPWEFIIIKNSKTIDLLSKEIRQKADRIFVGYNFILRSAATTISNANVLIAIYNRANVQKVMGKMGRRYQTTARATEMQSIAAAIQNMILAAEVQGIGSCWMTLPLLCEKQINKIVNTEKELVALLTLGYPSQKTKRSKRKDEKISVRYLR